MKYHPFHLSVLDTSVHLAIQYLLSYQSLHILFVQGIIFGCPDLFHLGSLNIGPLQQRNT